MLFFVFSFATSVFPRGGKRTTLCGNAFLNRRSADSRARTHRDASGGGRHSLVSFLGTSCSLRTSVVFNNRPRSKPRALDPGITAWGAGNRAPAIYFEYHHADGPTMKRHVAQGCASSAAAGTQTSIFQPFLPNCRLFAR